MRSSERTRRYTQYTPDKLVRVLRQFHKTFSHILQFGSYGRRYGDTFHHLIAPLHQQHIWAMTHLQSDQTQNHTRPRKSLEMCAKCAYWSASVNNQSYNVYRVLHDVIRHLKRPQRWQYCEFGSRSHRRVARPPVGSIGWYTHLCHSI